MKIGVYELVFITPVCTGWRTLRWGLEDASLEDAALEFARYARCRSLRWSWEDAAL